MIGTMGASPSEIYEAVLSLSRSIAGHTDLAALVSGVSESLRRIVRFDHLGLILHDRGAMQGHILSEPGNPVITSLRLPVEADPAGWVWLNQQPLILSSLDAETRWPEFISRARAEFGLSTFILVPLTAGENRLGAFGFSSVAPYEPGPAEMEFLERVAAEFAIAVEGFLARQAAVRERDRLRTLFDITNALVSKLAPDELFSAIGAQLSKLIPHDYSMLTISNSESRRLDLYALHSTGHPFIDALKGPFDPSGMPAAEVLATGKPVVAYASDIARYPAPIFAKSVALGFRSICSVPLIAPNRTIGTLALCRMTDDTWSPDDVAFLVQVANQIAIAVENSLAYGELAEMKERLATEKLYLEDEIRLDHNIGNMVGQGLAFQSILRSVQIVAPTDSTVLILGETGTGKELVARATHELSPRRKGSFVKVNCAAIPSSLLESELFGHEKGSFTGAVGQRIGRFELAHKGTLFLDEIGEMPLELQPKLLRAIQDQEFERVGGTRTIRTDVRFVAATNRDLKAMVDQNEFRADLYYRLHVFPLSVPPLRERREDIPLLTRYFVQKHAQRMGRAIDKIPSSAMDALTRYDWPGNIRELQNVLERSVILTHGNALQIAMPDLGQTGPSVLSTRGSSKASEATERQAIVKALDDARGQVGGPDGAAARLGMKRTTLQSRMRKLNIARQYH
jgi:formate hydrogenlyase transcriptional activator